MMGTKIRSPALLCDRSIEDLVPADNFYQHIEAELDLGFVRDLLAGYATRPEDRVPARISRLLTKSA